MGDELSRRQAQNGVNFDFEVKFDLEGQGQSPPKTIGILTKVFYTYGPNLVILAWTGDELSRGQTWWRTDGLTDGRTQATTIPEGQYWPRVKSIADLSQWCVITRASIVYKRNRVSCVLNFPDRKVDEAIMGPTWVLSAPDGPHVGPMNIAIRVNINAQI